MYVCRRAHEGQTLERAANMIIFLLLLIHFSYYSHIEYSVTKYGSTFYLGIVIL